MKFPPQGKYQKMTNIMKKTNKPNADQIESAKKNGEINGNRSSKMDGTVLHHKRCVNNKCM